MTTSHRPDIDEATYSKVAVAAYTIVGSVPHDTAELSAELVDAHIDDSWTEAECRSWMNMLRLYIIPMTPRRSNTVDVLEALGTPVNDRTACEARCNLIGGRIEARKRAPLVDHPLFADRDRPALHLLDNYLVQQARRVTTMRPVSAGRESAQSLDPAALTNNGYFAKPTAMRLSDQLDELLASMVINKKHKPDYGQRRRILETFAWIIHDKALSDYGPEDRISFVKA